MRVFVAGCVFVGSLAAAACAERAGQAQSTATLPAGVVRTASGTGVAGALVTVRLGDDRWVTVYADEAGGFSLPPHVPGGSPVRAIEPGGGTLAASTWDGARLDLTLAPDPDGLASLAPSGFLEALPDGETKRRFILDCSGCHVWSIDWIRRVEQAPGDSSAWSAAVSAMLANFGQGSGFPIVSSWPEAAGLGSWLAEQRLTRASPAPQAPRLVPWMPNEAGVVLTEYLVPVAGDLPHDLMVDASGQVVVTGMFTHVMYRLDPSTGVFATVPIPVQQANPRAIDIDERGRWWVALGGPGRIARYDPALDEWLDWSVGTYAHSIRVDAAGKVWFNGHFTVDPEIIGALDGETGEILRYEVPFAPTADTPRGESTIPYGLRVAPDGTVWATQLRGGHLIRLDPATGDVRQFKMPSAHAGPRRPDVAPDGAVWIPLYSAGQLARFDPRAERFDVWDLPIPEALPYVVRVDQRTGVVWIGTGHGDFMASFDPSSEAFTVYPLPTRGALVRHIDVDEGRGEVWAAYGASPGIPAKILRIQRGVGFPD